MMGESTGAEFQLRLRLDWLQGKAWLLAVVVPEVLVAGMREGRSGVVLITPVG